MKRLIFILGLAGCLVASAAGGPIDFNRDIRSILSDHCFQCHGPDKEALEADLRLDIRNSAVSGKEGAAIVEGDPSESELVHRITATDRDDLMPPPKTEKPLNGKQIALLKQWIEEGAEYEDHWSFQPIEKSEKPEVKEKKWPKNGIDHFILRRLEEEGIEPSPEADPNTLVRRMYLDLVGLLPDPERVEIFRKQYAVDPDEAVETLVSVLLSSSHYGERWGRHWLDQARYADSNGYTIDGERSMWPYRDWVIRAINDDMPFDQFTIEQLAGDLLENPTKAQLVASGFHRNTLINQEGGTDDEQFRNEEVVDRVNTTGAVWLGLTLGCSQCHSHKFDPITQQEYFELFAFFNQGTDVNNTGATVEVSEGELFLNEPDPELYSVYESARKKVDSLTASTAKRQAAWEKELLAKRPENREGANWTLVRPAQLLSKRADLKLLKEGSVLAGEGDANETYTITLPAPENPIKAIRLRVIPHESLPNQGPGRAGNGNFVLTEVEFSQGEEKQFVSFSQADHAQSGFPISSVTDGNASTGWAINVDKSSAAKTKMNAPHEAEFVFEKPLRPDRGMIEVVMRHDKNSNYNVGCFAFDTSESEPLRNREDRLWTLLEVPKEKRTAEQKKELTVEFAKVDTELKGANRELSQAKKALGLGSSVKAMVMRDKTEDLRETYLHVRGDFLRQDKERGLLHPGVPAIFPEMAKADKPETRNRIDLAQWLVRPDHPLTARVTVNRVWMRYFGKGLVETENDFGTQGTYPTHPELLDWLATQFVEGGWSMKKLHKLIVTSATYRQSSNARRDLEEVDPLNHLLARQNRIRFDSEIVRDAALMASGLLADKVGGPPVTPPQPDGVYAFTQRKQTWNPAEGSDRFRRGMYVKFIRSAPYPLLTTFDSPDFQSVCTARVRSNTPLQSLTMANDEALFEMAQGLGARLLAEVKGTDDTATKERIRRAYLLCYSREPSLSEMETLAGYLRDQMEDFAGEAAAGKSVAPEDIPDSYDTNYAAGWVSLARVLMNTDEFITRE